MHPAYDCTMPPLQAIFDGAKCFGLTDAEAWRVLNETLYETGAHATVGDYLDELCAALAREVLAKQRRAQPLERRTSEDERVLSEELF